MFIGMRDSLFKIGEPCFVVVDCWKSSFVASYCGVFIQRFTSLEIVSALTTTLIIMSYRHRFLQKKDPRCPALLVAWLGGVLCVKGMGWCLIEQELP